jgi:hypothetical protein
VSICYAEGAYNLPAFGCVAFYREPLATLEPSSFVEGFLISKLFISYIQFKIKLNMFMCCIFKMLVKLTFCYKLGSLKNLQNVNFIVSNYYFMTKRHPLVTPLPPLNVPGG